MTAEVIPDLAEPEVSEPTEQTGDDNGFDIGADLAGEVDADSPLPDTSPTVSPSGDTQSESAASAADGKPVADMTPEEILRANSASLSPEMRVAQQWMRERQSQMDRQLNQMRQQSQPAQQQGATPEQIAAAVRAANPQPTQDVLDPIRQEIRQAAGYQSGDEHSVDVVDRIVSAKYAPQIEQQQQYISQLGQQVTALTNVIQTQRASSLGRKLPLSDPLTAPSSLMGSRRKTAKRLRSL